jgi:hypothetical protein
MNRHVCPGFGSLRWLFAGLIGVAVVAGSAEAASVKCQERAVEAEIIVHERDGAVSVLRAEEMAEAGLNASFMAFATEVLGQLPGLLERAGLCTADGDRVMQAQFVHVPLTPEERREEFLHKLNRQGKAPSSALHLRAEICARLIEPEHLPLRK